MTIPIRSLPGFSSVSDFHNRYRLKQSQNRFNVVLSKVINVMMAEYNGYHADQAFDDFKRKFDDQKKRFESDQSKFSNLGFENFTQMMQVVAGCLDPFDHVGRNAQFVWGIQKFGFELRDVWTSLPYDHQAIIDEEGISFARGKHVKVIDFVEGISRAVYPLQIPDYVTDACFSRQKAAELAPIFRRSTP